MIAALCAHALPLYAQAGSDARLEALASLTEAKMKEYGVPGVALGVVLNGTVSLRGLGVTNVEDPLPSPPHTVFPIASISKTLAATAIMRLVEQGKIDLNAPVRTYIPDSRVRDEGNLSRWEAYGNSQCREPLMRVEPLSSVHGTLPNAMAF